MGSSAHLGVARLRPKFSSLFLGSSTHLGITRPHPSISSLLSGSSAHLGVTRLLPIIYESPLACPCCLLLTLLRYPLTLSPPPGFLGDFLQGCPELCLWSLLAPPCVTHVPSPLIGHLPCTYLEYWLIHQPLFHLPMSASNVSCS